MFFRKDPASSEIGTSSGNWNQTGELTIPTDGKNLFTPNGWTGCTGDWSTYGSSSEEEDLPDELPDAISCGVVRSVLFNETFGNLSTVTSRNSSSYVPSNYNYISECNKIQVAGSYAIVANPRYSGCTDTGDFENTCYCDPTKARLWYQDCGDHTGTDNADGNAAGSLGGMLQFDCNNGSNSDIMYQRTVTGICKNTLINFSVWLKSATQPSDLNEGKVDPIDARVILRKGGATGTIIGRKDIKQVKIFFIFYTSFLDLQYYNYYSLYFHNPL
jgi:hypothetical protein